MTLDEAIKHAEGVADKKEGEKQKWERWLETDNDYRATAEKVSCELCAEEHRQLAEWLKELKQLREQTRWIPVSERLPEKNKEVLTYSSGGYIEIQSIEGTYGYWENQKGDWSNIDEIAAWMPLPEPYKAESEDKE